MKQGKKTTRVQRELLSKRGYEWKDWLYVCEDEEAVCFVHKVSKQIEWVRK